MIVPSAAEVGGARDAVADDVTETFLARHPEWIDRYGDRARTRGVQDARHHIDFVKAALELDDPATFRDYAVWCRDVLEARGIGVAFLIENLVAIRAALAARLSPAAAEAVRLTMHDGIEALEAAEGPVRAGGELLSHDGRLYMAAAVSGRRADALAVVREAIRRGESHVDVYVDIFQAALYEVGRLWQSTGLTVAEEHMATATTQYILSVLHEEHSHPIMNRRAAVVTGVADDHHTVGASIIANVLDSDGWDVRFLGTNLPREAIISAVSEHRPGLVAISVTMSGCLPEARDVIADIRGSAMNPPRIIVGGGAFARDPNMWRGVNADGFAPDARHVVAVAHG